MIALAPSVSGPLNVEVPVTVKLLPTDSLPVIVLEAAVSAVIEVVASVADVVAVRDPKVALDPVKVPMVAVMALSAVATRLLMKELVLVLLVTTRFDVVTLVAVRLLEKRVVDVAADAMRFVVVAFVAVKLVKNPVVAFMIAAMMLDAESPVVVVVPVTVRFDAVVVASCVLPMTWRFVNDEVPVPVVTTPPLNVVVPLNVAVPEVMVFASVVVPPRVLLPEVIRDPVMAVVASVAEVVAISVLKVPVPAVIELRVRL